MIVQWGVLAAFLFLLGIVLALNKVPAKCSFDNGAHG